MPDIKKSVLHSNKIENSLLLGYIYKVIKFMKGAKWTKN